MKYVAKKLDLDLELITLSGEVANLSPKIKINGTNCIKLANEWKLLEETNLEKTENKLTGMELVAIELTTIYPKPKEWWTDNFDPITIREIVAYVSGTMVGVQKK